MKETRVTAILFLVLVGKLSVEAQHYRFSDLFFHDTFFLGSPPNPDAIIEPVIRLTKDIPPSEILELPDTDDSNNGGIFPLDIQWPNTDFEISDPGADVVRVFKENLLGRVAEIPDTSSDSDASGTSKKCENEKKSCITIYTFPARELCTIECLTKDNDLLKDLPHLLQKSMKYLCRTSHTFFTKMDEFKIKSFESYKAAMTDVIPRTITTNQAALRGMLAKLIRDVSSPLKRLRPMFDLFDELVKPTHEKIGLKDNVLVGNHPGCAMVDMKEPMDKMIDIITKDHSLLDYIVFQGYALFTSISKYVEDFQSKKPFVALNSVLDILTGTTCGLHKYAMTGETSNCDQFGGFPTLDMLLPRSLWKPKKHRACEQVRNKLLTGRSEDIPTDMDADDDGGTAAGTGKKVRRKRLTLKVDARNRKYFKQ